jgi:hypothetical protein
MGSHQMLLKIVCGSKNSVAILPGAHLHALIKDPSAIKWASLESRYKISDRLGPAEESFFLSLREIQQCLNELQKTVEAQVIGRL